MSNDNGTKLFCMGLGIGLAAAILYAPKSGRDSRRYLQDKANEGTDYLKRQSEEIANTATDMLDRGAKAVRHQKDQVVAAVVAGRDVLRNGKMATDVRDYQL